MKVCFLMFSMFPEWLIFRYLKYPSNRAFLGEGIAIRNLPSTYEFERFLVHAILCQITGKKVLEKIVLLLKKSLIFSPEFCMNHVNSPVTKNKEVNTIEPRKTKGVKPLNLNLNLNF